MYNQSFFINQQAGSRSSAEAIAPYLLETFRPRSIVDIGCGTGTWLKAFQNLGVQDLLGMDGEYVDVSMLQIEQSAFQVADLSKPLRSHRKYDMVISLEVAEHIPASASADFIHSLTALSDIVVFSAAIPGQGGTYHINEQWPHYWAELFKDLNYTCYDCIRTRYWDHANVQFWYSQNMFVYIHEQRGGSFLDLSSSRVEPREIRSYIHPKMLQTFLTIHENSLLSVQESIQNPEVKPLVITSSPILSQIVNFKVDAVHLNTHFNQGATATFAHIYPASYMDEPDGKPLLGLLDGLPQWHNELSATIRIHLPELPLQGNYWLRLTTKNHDGVWELAEGRIPLT